MVPQARISKKMGYSVTRRLSSLIKLASEIKIRENWNVDLAFHLNSNLLKADVFNF